jgi:hypothetical protein
MRSVWTRHESVVFEEPSLDPAVREDVVVGEAELSVGDDELDVHVGKEVDAVASAGVGAGEESTRTGVAKVAGVGAGEESTSTDVAKVAGVGAGEKLMSARVAAIADKVLVAMDALSASMLACHALQNTATNEQHNPACSRPCTKP